MTGPATPPGWSRNPSGWPQRLLIVALAFLGLQISRYLASYQLGHIDGVWDPFFAGGPGPRNGTEEIITSSVSEAWPVPDAGLGAVVYALEILIGVAGSQRRWRTMPWLVLLFGLLIVPLGTVSIFFIIIQPIWIGTWCTLCLVAAAAMLVQIPYALDELLATGQFLRRRVQAGQPLLRVLFVGDTDEGDAAPQDAALQPARRSPQDVLREISRGGVGLPWNLAAAAAIGASLMFTRLTVGATGSLADAHHLIGSLVVTVSVIACAEVARSLRYLNAMLGIALIVVALMHAHDTAAMAMALACGAALIGLALPRGPVHGSYGGWS